MHINEKELIMIRAAYHAKNEAYDMALSCIQMIIDADSGDSTAWFNKGYTLRLAGRLDDAWSLFVELHEKYPDKADVPYELGLLALESGDSTSAEEYFSECIALEPLNPEPMIERAKIWYEAKHYQRADDAFSEALVFDPDNASIRAYLGLISHHLGKPNEAERWFLESIDHDPDNPETWYHLARLYEEQGKREDEVLCYNRLIEINPEQIVPWLKKGMMCLASEDLKKSASCFRMASKLDSDSHLPHLLLGLVYNSMDLHEDAISSLEKAMALTAEPDILLQYGRILGSCSRYEEALKVFQSILGSSPGDPGAAEGYARSLYHLQRWEELIPFCESMRLIDPENPFWVTTLARVFGWHRSDPDAGLSVLKTWEEDGSVTNQISLVLVDLLVNCSRLDEARERLTTLAQKYPEDTQLLFRYSSLLAQMKEFTLAAEQFELLIAQKPDDVYLAYLAGQACEQAGDSDRALELFTIAITGMPGHAEIWLSRARALFDQGLYQEAALNAAQACVLAPDLYDAFLLKGMAEIHAEEHEKARVTLTCATTLDPGNPDGWGYLGDVLLISGEGSAAKICYERALELKPGDNRAHDGYQSCMDILSGKTPARHREESILDENP